MVAASDNGVIGVDGDLPWHLSADLKRFKKMTMGHHLIMGRKTFDSIGRCLPGRTTVIVTRNANFHFSGAKVVHTITDAMDIARDDPQPFVVGGGQIYELALPVAKTVYLTRVLTEIEGDVFFPIRQLDSECWTQTSVDGPHFCENENLHYQFEDYERRTANVD